NLIAPNQAVHIVGCSLGFRFVVDLNIDDLAAAELSALLFSIKPETGVDETAKFGISACIREHEPNLERRALREGGSCEAGGPGESGQAGGTFQDRAPGYKPRLQIQFRHGVIPSLVVSLLCTKIHKNCFLAAVGSHNPMDCVKCKHYNSHSFV